MLCVSSWPALQLAFCERVAHNFASSFNAIALRTRAAETELSGGHLVAAQRATARARDGALLPRASAAEPAVAIASVSPARDAGGARAARLLRQDAAPAVGALLGAALQRVRRVQPQPELHTCRSAARAAPERSGRRRLGALAARERRRARRSRPPRDAAAVAALQPRPYTMSAVARSAFNPLS